MIQQKANWVSLDRSPIDSGLESRVGGSLKLLSFYSAPLLLLALCLCRITGNFLINKLYTKGYLPPLANHVTWPKLGAQTPPQLTNLPFFISFYYALVFRTLPIDAAFNFTGRVASKRPDEMSSIKLQKPMFSWWRLNTAPFKRLRRHMGRL
jgi:hypothetical protein